MNKTEIMLDVMKSSPDTKSMVTGAFHHIGLAEEVLGDHKEVGLKLMMTTDALRGYSDGVYRIHVKELLDRSLAGEDTRPGTHAEILCALANASLKKPLANSGLHLMERCFEVCFPMLKMTKSKLGREGYPGELDEKMREARHMLRQDWRK